MRARHAGATVAAVLTALLALVTLVGCSSGHPPSTDSTPSSTATVTPSPTGSADGTATAANAASTIHHALAKALLTNQQVKLVRQKVKAVVASGIAVPTNIVCGDKKVDGSDNARVDRLQAWWRSKGWTSPDPKKIQVAVTSEVIAYRPGGVAASLKAYRSAPKRCHKVKFNDGSKGVVSSSPAPSGLPSGSVVLKRVITYSGGVSTTGFIIAIPAGNVMGMLYIDGAAASPKVVASTRSRLLSAYAKQVATAGVAIGTLTTSAAAN